MTMPIVVLDFLNAFLLLQVPMCNYLKMFCFYLQRSIICVLKLCRYVLVLDGLCFL